ncbi:MAG: hypothetical protein ACHP84_06535 [Caulobacterales bacterium]|jgi:hypothetical protein
MHRTLLTLLIAGVALGGCAKTVEAPSDPGVCYAMAVGDDGKAKFNVVATGIGDMEHCAAQLEAVRVRFLRLGSARQELTGAYQGNFLFLQPEGVFTSTTYDGMRFPFLTRTGDGRLAMPGAMPQR